MRGRRAGKYARSKANRGYLDHIRTNALTYALMFAVVYGATFALHRVWPEQFTDLFVGAMLLVPFWIVSLIAVGQPGTAKWARGADGEAWTGSALRRALRRQYVIIHDTQLGSSNIDHVVVGPAGVFVIETKWSGEPWASAEGAARIDAARRQAAGEARRVQKALDASGIAEVPKAVVVLWGGRIHAWTEKKVRSNMHGTIPAVPGNAIDKWTATLVPGALDDEQRRAIVSVVRSMNL